MDKCEHYTESIYYQLALTAKIFKYLGMQTFEKLNLPMSPEEFTTMDVMSVHEDICQRDLAKLILKDRPSTGRILNSLEEKGYIERFADTKNNRPVKRVRLTTQGKNECERIAKILREYISTLPKVISDEDKEKLKNSIIQFRLSLEQTVKVNI